MIKKRLLYIFRSTPYQNLNAQDGLDALLAGSIFEQDISVFFRADGVYQLLPNQAPTWTKNIQKQLKSLSLYDIDKVFVCNTSMLERGIASQQLSIPAAGLDERQAHELMHNQDHILTF